MTNRIVYDSAKVKNDEQEFQVKMRKEFGMELHHGSIVLYEGVYYRVRNDYDHGSVPYFYVMNNKEYREAVKDGRIS